MARTFNGSTQYIATTGIPVSDYPFTMACWAQYSSDVADRRTLMSLDHSVSSYHLGLQVDMAGSGNPVVLLSNTSDITTATSGPTSANAWFHAAGVWTSATSRAVYHNGSNKGTASGSVPWSAMQFVSIGARKYNSTYGRYWPGVIAECGVWNVALSDDEVAALGDGVSPLLVRTGALVGYWPVMGRTSPEIDVMGVNPASLINTPTQAAHPPMRYPGRVQSWKPAAAGAGATIAVPTGTLTLTGLAPLVRTTGLVVVPAGSLALTGLVPLVRTTGLVTVPTGSITLTGFAPSVIIAAGGATVAVPTGTLTLTGQAPTVLTPRTVAVPVGTLTLAGFAPSVRTTGTVAVPAGALTLTGYSPTVSTITNVLDITHVLDVRRQVRTLRAESCDRTFRAPLQNRILRVAGAAHA